MRLMAEDEAEKTQKFYFDFQAFLVQVISTSYCTMLLHVTVRYNFFYPGISYILSKKTLICISLEVIEYSKIYESSHPFMGQ